MATFALVGCDHPTLTAAGPAYLMCRTSPGFAGAWEQAIAAVDVTLILSPDYGLVHPQETLSPSDVGLGEERWSADADRWLDRVLRELAALRWLEEQHHFLLYAEGAWAGRLADALQQQGQTVDHASVQPRP